MAAQFQESLNTIHQTWQSSWLKYFFHFSSITPILRSKNTNPNFAYDFMQTLILIPSYLAKRLITYVHEQQQLLAFHHYLRLTIYLSQTKLFTQENFDILLAHENPDVLANAFSYLKNYSYLNQHYFNILSHSPNYKHFSRGIACLAQAIILSETHLHLLLSHPDIENFSYLILAIHQRGYLTSARYENLCTHPYLGNLTRVFYHLTIYLEENMVHAMIQAESVILFNEDNLRLWLGMPAQVIGRHLDALLETRFEPLPLQSFQNLVQHIMQQELPPFPYAYVANFFRRASIDAPISINPSQSTHTSSIHRSASSSALRLKLKFRGHYDLKTTLLQFHHILEHLDSSHPQRIPAQTAFKRMTHPELNFVDPQSKISLPELLGLAFVAIHDDACQAKLEDAEALLIEGLYEIQRGYNLEHGHEASAPDVSICASGAFNKILEKLHGIHPDVNLNYVTHGLASLKFPIIIQEHLTKLIETHACHIIEILESERSIERIWPQIKPKIEDAMWQEFHEAYQDNPEHPDFKALIASGIYFSTQNLRHSA